MRGQRALKHPALLAGHRRRREMVRVEGGGGQPVPRPPAGLLPVTVKTWRSLWRSRVAQSWDRSSDLPVVTRYALLLDRWQRYDDIVRGAPMVRGSKDQLRANPLASRMDAIESQLRSLEDQLGLTPAARLRLGISLVEAQTALSRQWTWDGREPEGDPYRALRE
jgi:P27 family predicted phage terminase small subunit